MKTRFKVIGANKDEDKYFDNLFEVLKEGDEIYEVDESDKSIVWIW